MLWCSPEGGGRSKSERRHVKPQEEKRSKARATVSVRTCNVHNPGAVEDGAQVLEGALHPTVSVKRHDKVGH